MQFTRGIAKDGFYNLWHNGLLSNGQNGTCSCSKSELKLDQGHAKALLTLPTP